MQELFLQLTNKLSIQVPDVDDDDDDEMFSSSTFDLLFEQVLESGDQDYVELDDINIEVCLRRYFVYLFMRFYIFFSEQRHGYFQRQFQHRLVA